VHPVEKINDPSSTAAPFALILQEIKTNRPDCILVASDSKLARELLNYLDNFLDESDKNTLFVLSDAAVSPQIRNGFGHLERVYVLYPISSRDYADPDSIIGRDAALVLQELIARAGADRPLRMHHTLAYSIRRLVSMHRVPDARQALAAAVLEEAKSSTPIQGTTGNQYTFRFPIGRKDGIFHIWHVSPAGGLKDVDALDASAPPNDTNLARHQVGRANKILGQ